MLQPCSMAQAVLKDTPDAGDAGNTGAPAWQQEKLGHCCAQLQRSPQGDAGEAEELLGEQSGISKGIRKAVPALRSFLTQGWWLPCPRVKNRLENTQRRRKEDDQEPRTAELTMETQSFL